MSTPLVFQKTNGGRLGVDSSALELLRTFVQQNDDPEAGGVLLGRFIEGGPDIVIDRVTGPLPGDRRARCRFFRHARAHQRVIDQEWVASGGTRTYLGEWHTHPERYPTPSSTDLRDWRQRIARDTFHGDTLHFLIVGQAEIRAWELRRDIHCPTTLSSAQRLEPTIEGQD